MYGSLTNTYLLGACIYQVFKKNQGTKFLCLWHIHTMNIHVHMNKIITLNKMIN